MPPPRSTVTSVHKQVNLGQDVMQCQALQSLQLHDIWGGAAKGRGTIPEPVACREASTPVPGGDLEVGLFIPGKRQ